MPMNPTILRDMLQTWRREVTWCSLHTAEPGPFGANEWQSMNFDRVRVVNGTKLIGVVNEFDRFPQHFSTGMIVVTHLAYRTSNGGVFAVRELGAIRLGRRDGIVVPPQLTIVTLQEDG
jgi:hypothetical protein